MAPSRIAHKPRFILNAMLVLVLLLLGCINPAVAGTGVCYGMLGNGLPSPQQTVSLYNQKNIGRMRIYDPNPPVLQALGGSNIELMVGVPNTDLQGIAASQANAVSWVQRVIQANPNVKFKYIVVGNEIRPNKDDTAAYARFLLPAMQNMQAVVTQAGFGGRIKVSTAFDFGILSVSYPPSFGKFDDTISSFYSPIIRFVADNGSPLMMNVYPYISYAGNSNIHLDYALFTAPGTVVTDPQGGLQYQNLFDAMVDAIYSALEKAGVGSVPVVVSESGWPTAGGKDTTTDNAQKYNNNLISHVRGGTPKRRGELETYIFAMFDENNKNPELEKHWGLYSNLQPKYPINF